MSSTSKPKKRKAPNRLGLVIAALRDARGFSNKELAAATAPYVAKRISDDAILTWVNGSRFPNLRTFLALCRALAVDPADVLEQAGLSQRSGPVDLNLLLMLREAQTLSPRSLAHLREVFGLMLGMYRELEEHWRLEEEAIRRAGEEEAKHEKQEGKRAAFDEDASERYGKNKDEPGEEED